MPLAKSEYLSETWKDGLFTNKVVFCTGGAGTICSAQVRALVHLGANACIIGRNVEKTEKAAQDIATARPGAKVIGIGAVDSVMDIDVLGSYNTLKATLPHLVESANKHKVDSKSLKPSPLGTGGRIIFVSATIHYRTMPFQTHVSVAKAGVDALSHSVAIEFGPLGVTSNIIAPGPIASTEGVDRLVPADAMEGYIKTQPLGRFGSVRDIADATVYLFADTGSYVSGQTLVVDGASWRMSSGGAASGALAYPDFLLTGDAVPNVKGQKSKL
ncbi:hypothetical protein APSETT445_006833 [Aspergillus pseudonomiae]